MNLACQTYHNSGTGTSTYNAPSSGGQSSSGSAGSQGNSK